MARVRATGMGTQLGHIAHLLASTEDTETPLQQRLARVTRTLLLACGGVVLAVAALGLWRGEGWLTVMLSSISLAVAAVPEGLPAVVTIALALGVQRMAARNALVRRLQAVETLGSATVVCTDKTGTLTQGTMRVREVWGPDADAVLFAAAACSDASLKPDGTDGTGDPTELALLRAAAERGFHRETIERESPRVAVHPFDSDTRRMAILRADGVLYVKGALEVLVPRSAPCPEGIEEEARRMASGGLRVLAVARGAGEAEEHLTLLGLIGMADPPRPEAVAAVAAARAAGVRTVMVTGDGPVTALAIGRELGPVREGDDAAALIRAWAMAFFTLVFAELFRAFAARSGTRLFWEVGAFTNKLLLGVIAFSAAVQLALHELPAMQRLFELKDLHAGEMALAAALGLIPVTALEPAKLLRRWVRRPA